MISGRHCVRCTLAQDVENAMFNQCSGVMPLLVILASPAHASDAIYTVTELGTLGGDCGSVALSINNAGQIVGRSSLPDNGYFHAFFWQLGAMIDLDPEPPEQRISWASGINDLGTIVGLQEVVPGQPSRPVIFANGSFIDLGSLGGYGGWAMHINNAGTVVGKSPGKAGFDHAVMWTARGITDLGSIGGFQAWAHEINESGCVVGTGSDQQGHAHALMWVARETADLGNLGGTWAGASSINDDGIIVGNSQTAAGATHGFRWTASEGMVDLGAFPGCVNLAASDINRHGEIVGAVWPCKGSGFAVLWKDGRIIDLNTVVPPGSIAIYGAGDINDAGQIIGTSGRKAVLLTPVSLGDIDNDGHVAVIDLLVLLASWGGCAADCPADLNHDGVVDRLDLMLLLGNWHS